MGKTLFRDLVHRALRDDPGLSLALIARTAEIHRVRAARAGSRKSGRPLKALELRDDLKLRHGADRALPFRRACDWLDAIAVLRQERALKTGGDANIGHVDEWCQDYWAFRDRVRAKAKRTDFKGMQDPIGAAMDQNHAERLAQQPSLEKRVTERKRNIQSTIEERTRRRADYEAGFRAGAAALRKGV